MTTRLAKLSGLGSASRPLPIARCDARLLPRQPTAERRRPRAGLSAGPYTLLECKAVTTRLAKLSGLGSASRPAY